MILSFIAVIVLCFFVGFDYGIVGVLLPVLVALPSFGECFNARAKMVDNRYIKILLLGIGILFMPFSNGLGNLLYYGLLSLPILLLYSGKRGKYNLKYFFYLGYPAHLVIIYLFSLFI